MGRRTRRMLVRLVSCFRLAETYADELFDFLKEPNPFECPSESKKCGFSTTQRNRLFGHINESSYHLDSERAELRERAESRYPDRRINRSKCGGQPLVRLVSCSDSPRRKRMSSLIFSRSRPNFNARRRNVSMAQMTGRTCFNISSARTSTLRLTAWSLWN